VSRVEEARAARMDGWIVAHNLTSFPFLSTFATGDSYPELRAQRTDEGGGFLYRSFVVATTGAWLVSYIYTCRAPQEHVPARNLGGS